MKPLPDWPPSGSGERAIATIKASPEDFRVFEIPQLLPEGTGTHLWLEVEKIGANSEWVAQQLASRAGVHSRDIGYAGMKDRYAVTRQWYSIACQEARDTEWQHWEIEGVRILTADWHPRKLQRGTLKGNRFEITLRDIEGDADSIGQSLSQIAREGVPNYFGPQRFGHGGSNVERARHWFVRQGRIPRNKRSLYLSAARSFMFNQVLAERVRQGNWNLLMDGDVAMLDGRRSVFVAELPDSELEQRCLAGEIHPAGCLFGEGGLDSERDAAALMATVVDESSELCNGLLAQRVKKSWRSLRLIPTNMKWQGNDAGLVLAFDLPTGAYATTLLAELVSVSDASISKSA